MDRYEIVTADADTHSGIIYEMTQELCAYEKAVGVPKLTADDLKSALTQGHCHALLALERNDGKPAGYCIYYYGFSTRHGRIVVMEDLFVQEAHRRNGLGGAIWRQLAQICQSQNIGCMCWDVLDWNENAIEFYRKMGAVDAHLTEGWLNYRLYGDKIDKLANSKP